MTSAGNGSRLAAAVDPVGDCGAPGREDKPPLAAGGPSFTRSPHVELDSLPEAAATVKQQFSLLGREPAFRRLFLASLGSAAGTYLAAIALTVDVFDRTGSGTWVSALLIAEFVPIVAIGLLLAPIVDRFSRRRLLIASDLLRFAVFLALPLAGSALAIVALAAIAGIATGVFRPAVYAGTPNLVSDDDLPSANSLLQSSENLMFMIGPVLGGLLLVAQGPETAYVVNAASYLFSAVLLARIPARMLQAGKVESKGHWRDISDGIGLVVRSRPLLTVLVAWNIATLGNGAINVAEVVLAKVSLDSGDFGFGVLIGAGGLGATIGSLFAAPALERLGAGRLYALSILAMALGYGLAAVSPHLALAAPAVAFAGLGNGAAVVCNALLVQRGAPDAARGRAFLVIMSSNYVLLAASMIAAGYLTDEFGPRWVWGGAAVAYAVGALAAASLGRGLELRQPRAELTEASAIPLESTLS